MASILRWTKRLLLTIGGLVLGLAVLTAVFGKLFSAPRYEGPASDHFDGTRFSNLSPTAHSGFGKFLKWQRERHPPAWQDRNTPPGPKPPDRVGKGELRVTFINHATVLVQQDGLNILCDPIWSHRASPVSFAGPRRYHPPGIAFEDLPTIDVVLVSHNHYDHLDLPTLRRLQEKHLPRFFVGLGNRALFIDAGIASVAEIDWWSETPLSPEVSLTGVPAQHFSGRGLFDRDGTLWLGFAIKGPAGLTYFAGDTGAGPHFAALKKRLGAPRLALLPIGAFRPEWFMSGVHVSPAEAVAAHDALGAGTSVGIHFGTFPLADDGQDEPRTALAAALGTGGSRRFWVLAPGEGRPVP